MNSTASLRVWFGLPRLTSVAPRGRWWYWEVTVPIDHPAGGQGWHTFVGLANTAEHALRSARAACEHPVTDRRHRTKDDWDSFRGLRPGWTAHWDQAVITPWQDMDARRGRRPEASAESVGES